jgi:hypothetical protein
MEPMTVRVEIWPVAADQLGVWLVSGGDAWRDALPVMADSEPHSDVELLLSRRGARDAVVWLHSTSWRTENTSVVLTYLAALRTPELVRVTWPDALPVSPDLLDAVGKPFTHAPDAPPVPRHIDVLLHGLGHMATLIEPGRDATTAAALDGPWQQHLTVFEPTMAGMYSEPHVAAP